MQPMYLDTIEADDKSHGNSWSRRADELFEEGVGDEGGGNDHMNISGTDNVSVWPSTHEYSQLLTHHFKPSLRGSSGRNVRPQAGF